MIPEMSRVLKLQVISKYQEIGTVLIATDYQKAFY